MCDENKNSDIRDTLKALGIIAAVLAGIGIIACVVISMLPTVGGSFGFGFPSGSGGRAIRDVEIDVEPQVIYRIDDHRFFTLEKYLDCSFGGFVYYNDTNKKIKVLAGHEGADKRPQNEFTISQPNGVMDFHSKFIYAASDNIIAYPGSNVSYKYGFLNYFIAFKNITNPSKNSEIKVIGSIYDTITITNDAIYTQVSNAKENYKKYPIPKKSDDYEWINTSDVHFNTVSQDDHFHCDNNIKPRRVKYIAD
jgi:hypothetical protein